jgi:hypothetical protein
MTVTQAAQLDPSLWPAIRIHTTATARRRYGTHAGQLAAVISKVPWKNTYLLTTECEDEELITVLPSDADLVEGDDLIAALLEN